MTKSNTFRVDDDSPRPLVCDIDTLVDTRMLVQANSGGGKSYVLRRILEQTHGRVQQLVLDPEGEFSSLRKRFDYVHAAAADGDCLAHPRSAALLAQKLLKLGVSAILDLYELKAHERILFVRLFCEALINAPKALWHPVLVVIDEAHVFAPQVGSAESTAAVIDLASRGRKRGFAAVLATQRIQKLHKDAAAECNNKLIGRTTLDVDLARAADELGFTKTMWRELRDLPAGDFFASGPAFNMRGVSRVHVGAVQTPHPKAGSRIAYTAPPPTSAIRALLPQLADLQAEAAEQAKTLAELQSEVVTLRKELSKKPAPEQVPKIIEVPRTAKELRDQILRVTKDVSGLLDQSQSLYNMMCRLENEQASKIAALKAPAAKPVEPKGAYGISAAERAKTSDRGRLIRKIVPPDASSGALPKGQRAILTVLAQSADNQSSKSRLALLAGYSPNGGGFNNYLSTLRTQDLLRTQGDLLLITQAGLDALGPYEPMPTGEALHNYWLDKCGKAERAVLSALIEAYPNAVAKTHVAFTAGYQPDGGGFNNALSRLRTMELIEGRSELRAVEALFAE